MSLLMDALKRAEKARQAEASSDGAELDLAATQGFSLDPIDESASGERPLPREPTLDQPVSPSDSSDALSLEDTRAMQGRLGMDEEAPLEDTGGRSLEDSISIIDDEGAVDVDHSIPGDTSATLPSLKQARRSVDNYFDGTGSASMTRDDLQAAMSDAEATAPHQRVTGAGDTETQRRVRAVFHAKEASRGRQGRSWVVAGLLPLLLLAVVGGLVFLYWDSLQALISNKSGSVQAQRPAPPPAQRKPAGEAATTGAASAKQAAAGKAPAAPAEAPASTAAAPSTGSGTTTSAPAGESAQAATTAGSKEQPPSMTELARTAPSAAEVTTPAAASGQAETVAAGAASGRRLSAQEYVAQKIESARLAPTSPTLKIKRRTKADRLHPLLVQAYDAWRAGDLVEARRLYERVLRADSRNRNALLGLGAIDVRTGLWDEASRRYTALLRLNPRDSVAQAGLIAVHENVDPLRGESQIKLLLREEPAAPHLHFTLGNMYAEQGRWGEAQSAYFDAYRLDSDNPDYTYNLAVSLDQLGKGDAATDYYRRALELAARNGAAFDQPSVRDRLLRLAFEGTAQ
jgi:tetratricopeptide (TPR) repeat protein